MIKFKAVILGLIYLVYTDLASADDRITYDAHRCVRHFQSYERHHKIPPNLLKAISLTESGIYHPTKKQVMTWPWTINYRGKGYYFKTKKDAVKAVRTIVNSGDKMVDVGCMQINLHYHPEAFDNIDQAFEPAYNIAYAAKFLRENFERLGSWNHAVAAYHSEDFSKGKPYLARVLKHWRRNSVEQVNYASFVENNYKRQRQNLTKSKQNKLVNNKPYQRYKQGKLHIQVTSYQPEALSQNKAVSNISKQLIKNYR